MKKYGIRSTSLLNKIIDKTKTLENISGIKPKVIYAGSKIMIMTIRDLKLRFVDTLNFLTMPLAKFPKTFGIKELKKGFYPYWFNCEKNFHYIGVMPERRLFKPNQTETI